MPGDTAALYIDLQNGNEIAVISPEYKDIGMIGPTDKITLYYKIKANDNISNANGTYLMDFGVSGGYELVQINREIPIRLIRPL
jgi:hypothetical protein